MTVITEYKVLRKGTKIKSYDQMTCTVRMTLVNQNHSAERDPLNESENHLRLKTSDI